MYINSFMGNFLERGARTQKVIVYKNPLMSAQVWGKPELEAYLRWILCKKFMLESTEIICCVLTHGITVRVLSMGQRGMEIFRESDLGRHEYLVLSDAASREPAQGPCVMHPRFSLSPVSSLTQTLGQDSSHPDLWCFRHKLSPGHPAIGNRHTTS